MQHHESVEVHPSVLQRVVVLAASIRVSAQCCRCVRCASAVPTANCACRRYRIGVLPRMPSFGRAVPSKTTGT